MTENQHEARRATPELADGLRGRLTSADADEVVALGQQQHQSFHQQQSFVVARHRGLALAKHLIQRRRLDLNTQHTSVPRPPPAARRPCGTATLTICTVWLNSSRSAVTEEIWSIRRCFLEKKRSRRLLSERQDATLRLYSSFSFLTTAQQRGVSSTAGGRRRDRKWRYLV